MDWIVKSIFFTISVFPPILLTAFSVALLFGWSHTKYQNKYYDTNCPSFKISWIITMWTFYVVSQFFFTSMHKQVGSPFSVTAHSLPAPQNTLAHTFDLLWGSCRETHTHTRTHYLYRYVIYLHIECYGAVTHEAGCVLPH